MKLLLVVPEYYPHPGGGIASYYRTLLPRCVARGHTVDVILASPHTQGDQTFHVDGVTVWTLNPQRFARHRALFRRLDALPDLRNYLAAAWAAWEQTGRGQGYDVVHAADWGLGFVPWVVGDSAVPVHVELHGSVGQIEERDPRSGRLLEAGIVRLIESSLLRHADALSTFARANAAEWQRLLGTRVEAAPPGVVLPDVAVPLSRHTTPERGVVVGRVQAWKGPAVLAEALRRIGPGAPHVEWIGRDTPRRGSDLTMSAWLAHTYPDIWGSKISWNGSLPPEQTRQRQMSANFGVVPSTWDVFNWTCVEMMGIGRPVVCSTAAGAADLVRDGENGFLFQSEDPEALLVSIERLREATPRLPELCDAARQTVADQLDPQHAADGFLARADALRSRGRSNMRPDAWLHDFVAPSEADDDGRALLDRLPLRTIVHHGIQRGLSKASWVAGRSSMRST